MIGNVSVRRTKKHLVVKIPLEEIGDTEEKSFSEEDVLGLADKGLLEYKAGKTESFKDFIERKYPEYSCYLDAGR